MDFLPKNNNLVLKLKRITIFKYGKRKTRLISQRKAYFCSINFVGLIKKRGRKTIITIFATKFNHL